MNQRSGSQRLERLLKLIPFLQKNAGVSLSQAAALFGITEKQLVSDLDLIWLCGLPGYSHLELIDVSYDSGFITISNAEVLNSPMRISFDEGATLLLAITRLIEIVPPADAHVLKSLQEKISKLIAVDLNSHSAQNANTEVSLVLPEIQKAILNRTSEHALEIDYFSATLNDYFKSQIIPIEMNSTNGFLYLIGYSLAESRYRHFRIDRIANAIVIPMPDSHKDLEPDAILKRTAHDHVGLATQVSVEVAESAYWFIQKWGLSTLSFDPGRKLFVGEISVYNPIWLQRACLSTAGALSVVAPEDLRAQMAAAAHRALENYADPVK